MLGGASDETIQIEKIEKSAAAEHTAWCCSNWTHDLGWQGLLAGLSLRPNLVKEVRPLDANKKPLPRSRKYRKAAKAPKHRKNYSTVYKKYRVHLLGLILLADALLLLDHILRTV
jgi:hypothetical protein